MTYTYTEAAVAVAHDTITVAGTAVPLTAATVTPTTMGPVQRVVITFEDAPVRVTWDGTVPTSTLGHLFAPGDVLILEQYVNIKAFQAIRTGGTSGTLHVTYER